MVSCRWLVVLCGATFASRPNIASRTSLTAIAAINDLAARMRQGSTDSFAAVHEIEQMSRQMVERMGNATTHLTTEEIGWIQQVIQIISQNMFGSMTTDHNTDSQSLTDASDKVVKCNTDMAAKMTGTGTVFRLKAQAEGYQQTYDAKQVEVQTLTTTRDSAKTSLTNHMSTVASTYQAPTAKCTSLPAQAIQHWDPYFEQNTFVDWFDGQRVTYQSKREAYRTAENNLSAKNVELSTVDTQLRTQYCAFIVDLHGVCQVHDVCYTGAEEDFDTLKTNVESRATERKKNFRAGSLAIAHLKFLIAESESDVEVEVNTAVYHISVLDIAAKQACEITQPAWEDFLIPSECQAQQQQLYVARGLVADEGSSVGDILGTDLDSCKQACSSNANCMSFSWSTGQEGHCHLKDKVVTASDASNSNSWAGSYQTYYAPDQAATLDTYGGGWTFVNEEGRSKSDIDDLTVIAVGGYDLPEYEILSPFNEVLVQRTSANWCDSWRRSTGYWKESNGASMGLQADSEFVYTYNNEHGGHSWLRRPANQLTPIIPPIPPGNGWDDDTHEVQIESLESDGSVVKIHFQELKSMLKVGNLDSFFQDFGGCDADGPVSYRVYIRDTAEAPPIPVWASPAGFRFERDGILNAAQAYDVAGTFTMCAGLKAEEGKGFGRILTKRQGASGWEFVAPRLNGLVTFFSEQSGHVSIGETRVDDGSWHHVAVVYDAVSGEMTAFVDGKPDGVHAMTVSPYSGADLVLGAVAKGDDYEAKFVGDLKDVQVFNEKLSTEQIEVLSAAMQAAQ